MRDTELYRYLLGIEKPWKVIKVELDLVNLGATRILRISWDEAWHILGRAIKRGLGLKKSGFVLRLGWMRSRWIGDTAI